MIATNSNLNKKNFFRNFCFLCRSKTKTIIYEQLKLYHFGKKKIGYGICSKCGLVMQTISPTIKELINFYKQNFYFEDFKKPKKNKVESIKRQIRMIKQELDIFPESVLEVSLMSIYNLLQFKKEGAKILHGIEPSVVLNNKIKKKFNIKIFNDVIENFKSKINYDLILMSHVLEHLHDPKKALIQCYKNQKVGQKVLAEVPLFDRTDLYPPSGLNVEHLYYFDEFNFVKMLNTCGYEVLVVEKIYKSNHLPFLSVLAEKKSKKNLIKQNETNYRAQIIQLNNYKRKITEIYKRVNQVLAKLDKNKPTYLFGSGFTASNFIFYTKVEKKFDISGILDNSKVKQNKFLCGIKIKKPYKNEILNSNIIITSIGSNQSIMDQFREIKSNINFYGFDKNFYFKKLN